MAPLRAHFCLAVMTPRGAPPCMFRGCRCGRSACRGGAESLLSRQRPLATDSTDAQKRTERTFDPDRPRHAHGPAFPLLLDAGAPCRGTAGGRMPAGAGQDHVRAAPGVSRFAAAI